ncbi:coenzyme F420-0:L-glutamate ligase [Variovorax sp. PBL-E5]|uniref:coenzyme F420-0:L-glutamate ligase n=1 Tax=Variovorax sp. PBL-E5 TaxID=434014 RepID=UPI0013162F21|nr:coenzyme F420-0:L-glutamate ligase [Variovorax sp. PBL-E5]VTU45351.1 Coenzyme F420:L-glutamate ligase [Variovorax sp. PBL-E5]
MRVELFSLPAIPEVHPGDVLSTLIDRAMRGMGERWQEGDVIAIAQKIVSKSEGRFRCLADIAPGTRALEISHQCGKDARKVQAILDESTDILRVVPAPPDGIIIARHVQGWVCANAGIDESNLGDAEGQLLLLPLDPDASASRIASDIEAESGIRPGVVITDTFGRPWRKGLVNIALGADGIDPFVDWVGRNDAYGRRLAVTQQALADEVAAASGLLMAKDAATPVIVLRGLSWARSDQPSCRRYVRALTEDLFQ